MAKKQVSKPKKKEEKKPVAKKATEKKFKSIDELLAYRKKHYGA